MVDTITEGYLVAAMALIPVGISMVTTAQDLATRIVGIALVGLGILAVVLRGQQKDKIYPEQRTPP